MRSNEEKDQYSPFTRSIKNLFRRISVSASKKKYERGSVTVEAAIAIPIFFLAVVAVLYLFEIMAIKTSVRTGLQYAGKKAAEESYLTKTLQPSAIENAVIQAVGTERLERSIVVDGSSGISCSKSRMSMKTGIGTLRASYKIRIPIPVFGIQPINCKESLKIKAWVGYEKEGLGNERDETVYVTATGLVYHKDYHCTHLDLSIHMVSASELSGKRNESGGKYYPCRQCHASGKGTVYITDTGDSYHASVSCSGLKRTVYAVPLSEVIGKGACSRCGR